jgi:hypothetical protein
MPIPGYSIRRTAIRQGFDGRSFWAQARAGVIPDPSKEKPPTVLMTAQPALRSGSDVYFALSEWRSHDLGETWDGPLSHPVTLGRREDPDRPGITVAICDMTPTWHAATGTLLATGQTVRYRDDNAPIVARRRETAYSTYSPETRSWTRWRTLEMPNRPVFASAGAGSTQRVDLDDGTILLPIYFKPISGDWHANHTMTVVRCAFDGMHLRYIEHGTEMTVPEPRGLCEPSLTHFQGRFYLTLRNDVQGYVATSEDGLHFEEPRPWCFDDGKPLGNYNTQQHWVRHRDGLFLVYTRRGLDNDHVFRHRAPLMMAAVDPESLVVRRETEQALIPNRGARLGNFGVCPVTENETWVVAAEWMQPEGCEAYGSDNTIWAARILWDRPNDGK